MYTINTNISNQTSAKILTRLSIASMVVFFCLINHSFCLEQTRNDIFGFEEAIPDIDTNIFFAENDKYLFDLVESAVNENNDKAFDQKTYEFYKKLSDIFVNGNHLRFEYLYHFLFALKQSEIGSLYLSRLKTDFGKTLSAPLTFESYFSMTGADPIARYVATILFGKIFIGTRDNDVFFIDDDPSIIFCLSGTDAIHCGKYTFAFSWDGDDEFYSGGMDVKNVLAGGFGNDTYHIISMNGNIDIMEDSRKEDENILIFDVDVQPNELDFVKFNNNLIIFSKSKRFLRESFVCKIMNFFFSEENMKETVSGELPRPINEIHFSNGKKMTVKDIIECTYFSN